VLLRRRAPQVGVRGLHDGGHRLHRVQAGAGRQRHRQARADPRAPGGAGGAPAAHRGDPARGRPARARHRRRDDGAGAGDDRALVKALSLGRASGVATVVATFVAVGALAWAVGLRGCGEPDGTPVGAVRAFVAAARAEDKTALWELLGPESRKVVTAAAAAATDKVGGARRLGPLEVLDVGARAGTYAPSDIVLRDSDAASATV